MTLPPTAPPGPTEPAPPIPPHSPPPSDLAASLEEHGPGQSRSTDPSVVDASLIRHALAAMSQHQSDFMDALNIRLDEWSGRISAGDERLSKRIDVLESLLIGRFDGIDEQLTRLTRAAELQNELTGNLNQFVSGVRNASESNYNMVTSVARKLERMRDFLNIPDAIANEPAETADAGAGSGDEFASKATSRPSGR